mmetsp:Transcript_17882/g.50704  ORF Transcript_17882/g.50704 Transcript_17882/m.50704 type:complete len:206 (-) Transcript_17882:2877-3494(-)
MKYRAPCREDHATSYVAPSMSSFPSPASTAPTGWLSQVESTAIWPTPMPSTLPLLAPASGSSHSWAVASSTSSKQLSRSQLPEKMLTTLPDATQDTETCISDPSPSTSHHVPTMSSHDVVDVNDDDVDEPALEDGCVGSLPAASFSSKHCGSWSRVAPAFDPTTTPTRSSSVTTLADQQMLLETACCNVSWKSTGAGAVMAAASG